MRLLAILAILVTISTAAFGDPVQQIFVSSSGIIRGPFTNGSAQSGEIAVTLTPTQYQQIDALRRANTGISAPILTWNATSGTAALAPIAQLDQQLLTIYNSLAPFEQAKYASDFSAVIPFLKANDAQSVYGIIYLSGSGGTAAIATARQQMLDAIKALFPSVTTPQ
jgi:hypothetical protein